MKLGPDHVCIVQNGHYGDIIDLLPVAHHLHQQGKTVHWLVPPAHRDLFDAVSYVKPVDFEMNGIGFRKMLEEMNQRFERVIPGGIWDFGGQGTPMTQSYNMEHWRCAGFLDSFFDPNFTGPLDRYDWAAHEAFIPKPIVCNVTSGKSSPFHYGGILLRKIQAAFPGMVMDIGSMQLPRFLDLLPIINSAQVFIGIDSGPLWLTTYTPRVPVVALVNPFPWGGSVLRRKLNARVTYREAQFEPGCVIRPIEFILRVEANSAWRTEGEPARKGNFPQVFQTGQIEGQSNVTLRHAAIKAWKEVLSGCPPPLMFHEIMTAIAKRMGVKTSDLIEFKGARTADERRPVLP